MTIKPMKHFKNQLSATVSIVSGSLIIFNFYGKTVISSEKIKMVYDSAISLTGFTTRIVIIARWHLGCYIYAIETLNLYKFTDAKPFPVDLRQRSERLYIFFCLTDILYF